MRSHLKRLYSNFNHLTGMIYDRSAQLIRKHEQKTTTKEDKKKRIHVQNEN